MKRTLLSACLLGLTVMCVAPMAWADPPPWAPAHGWRAKHQYTYYPRGEVYYARDTRQWFWLDGGNWRSGIRLPADFQTYVQIGGVSIELGSDRPYTEHTYVVEHYGGEEPRFRHDDRGDGYDQGYDRGHGHGYDKHDKHDKHDKRDKHDKHDKHGDNGDNGD